MRVKVLMFPGMTRAHEHLLPMSAGDTYSCLVQGERFPVLVVGLEFSEGGVVAELEFPEDASLRELLETDPTKYSFQPEPNHE